MSLALVKLLVSTLAGAGIASLGFLVPGKEKVLEEQISNLQATLKGLNQELEENERNVKEKDKKIQKFNELTEQVSNLEATLKGFNGELRDNERYINNQDVKIKDLKQGIEGYKNEIKRLKETIEAYRIFLRLERDNWNRQALSCFFRNGNRGYINCKEHENKARANWSHLNAVLGDNR